MRAFDVGNASTEAKLRKKQLLLENSSMRESESFGYVPNNLVVKSKKIIKIVKFQVQSQKYK